MAGGKVAKANEGEAAEPTMDEAKAELTGLVKQLGILPLLWGSGKIDFTQEDNVYYLRAGFCVVLQSASYVFHACGRFVSPGSVFWILGHHVCLGTFLYSKWFRKTHFCDDIILW